MTNPYVPPDTQWGRATFWRVEVGSTAHGTGLPGVEDYDEIGIFVPSWDQVIGLTPGDETHVYRPGRGPGDRSGPGDYDLTVHSVRKWARLVASGNPSMLVSMFGPVRYHDPRVPGPPKEAFYSKKPINAFLGHAKQQRERLEGVRGGKHTNRPELIEQFGYDTKYAMHMVRLGMQGLEYMTTGELKFPIPGRSGEILRDIRAGKYSMEDCIAIALINENDLACISSDPYIPDAPDLTGINLWLRDVYEWGLNIH